MTSAIGEIGPGLVVLVAVGKEDSAATASDLAEKIVNLRIFNDDQGKMNRSVADTGGEVLAVSQFTLYGDARGQRRPSFIHAAPAETGKELYGEFVKALRALGVRVAMDDFGAGYSSLSYLQSFPFDTIKIDRAFISNVDCNPQSAAIVRAVIGLARGLSVPVVAEGVETRDQLAFLAREACDHVQGYLMGRPAPIDELRQLGLPIVEDAAQAFGSSGIAATPVTDLRFIPFPRCPSEGG